MSDAPERVRAFLDARAQLTGTDPDVIYSVGTASSGMLALRGDLLFCFVRRACRGRGFGIGGLMLTAARGLLWRMRL